MPGGPEACSQRSGLISPGCSACCKSSVTPTPPPGAAPHRAPQVTMSGNHVGKTMPPDYAGTTVYATVRGMTAIRLVTAAGNRHGQQPPDGRAGAA